MVEKSPKQTNRIASKQVTRLQDWPITVTSPSKTKPFVETRSSTYSDSDSDCEIIELETPIIEIDIDINEYCANEAIESSTQTKTIGTVENALIETACASDPSNETAIESNAQCIVSFDSTAGSTEIEPTSDEVNCISKSKSPETTKLFFIDKNPATCFEAPIYEINSAPITNTNLNMAQNFRITVQNKENNANFENSFAPNPLLSSTRLNISCDAVEESSGSSSNNDLTQKQPENLHISINSTCENGSERCVSVPKSSPVANLTKWQQVIANRINGVTTYGSGERATNGNSDGNTNKNGKSDSDKNDKNNNTGSNSTAINSHNKINNIGGITNTNSTSNNTSSTPKWSTKRKASIEFRHEPPSKRSHSESSDVIILNDSINDEDDSVVFVSETLDHQNRNRASLARAANYIAFVNSINQTQNSVSQIIKRKNEKSECNRIIKHFVNNQPKSTRAKRKQERKKAEKVRATQAKLKVLTKQQKTNQNNGKMARFESRFGARIPITPPTDRPAIFPRPTTSTATTATATVTSARAAKNQIAMDYWKEKKLFTEKPELFEKRLIVIDGSNVAFAYVYSLLFCNLSFFRILVSFYYAIYQFIQMDKFHISDMVSRINRIP